mmetsp:Transcript_14437/g.41212  ORF Transcript_14437/g.41212 Transcript_14437/m.41212 type:complete len:204 (+) Transcript_14437:290-901(+)
MSTGANSRGTAAEATTASGRLPDVISSYVPSLADTTPTASWIAKSSNFSGTSSRSLFVAGDRLNTPRQGSLFNRIRSMGAILPNSSSISSGVRPAANSEPTRAPDDVPMTPATSSRASTMACRKPQCEPNAKKPLERTTSTAGLFRGWSGLQAFPAGRQHLGVCVSVCGRRFLTFCVHDPADFRQQRCGAAWAHASCMGWIDG